MIGLLQIYKVLSNIANMWYTFTVIRLPFQQQFGHFQQKLGH